MSEKYINAYIDTAIGTIHEYLAVNLQLKAQMKVIGDLIAEKDSENERLTNIVNQFTSTNDELNNLRSQLSDLQREADSLRNKSSHIDTFTNQIKEMKNALIEKDGIIEDNLIELRKRDEVIENLKSNNHVKKIVANKKTRTEVDDDF